MYTSETKLNPYPAVTTPGKPLHPAPLPACPLTGTSGHLLKPSAPRLELSSKEDGEKVYSSLLDWFSLFLTRLKEQWQALVLWANSSFNSESSPLYTYKILRLGNYQNLSYKQLSGFQNEKLLLWTRCLGRWCMLMMLKLIEETILNWMGYFFYL